MPTLNGFNANDVDPNFAFEAIPAGKYLAVITESEEKPTKSGSGKFVQFTFQIIEGEYKDRLVWSRLNLDNPNAMTVKIARAELSAICRAVGVPAPKDSVELHNIPLVITVGQKKRADTGEMGNVIKGYAKRDAVAPRPQAVAGNNGTPPWKR
ncbi:MAG: hypothetical protein CHACPFDD_03163 [Phycisphaerae bacterium]|nr:hypothetical protein [Phycisphaerae bacterium]